MYVCITILKGSEKKIMVSAQDNCERNYLKSKNDEFVSMKKKNVLSFFLSFFLIKSLLLLFLSF